MEHIPRLRRDGHRLYIPTSREGAGLAIAKRLLAIHGLADFDQDPEYGGFAGIIGLGYGRSVTEFATKVDAANVFELDVHIDDDRDTLDELREDVTHRLLFTTERNRDQPVPQGVQRIQGWPDGYRHISRIALAPA